MKKILLILPLLVVLSCKKKKVEPVFPPPPPKPVPCVTRDTLFSGKYEVNSQFGRDTIAIIFLKNNCPHEKQNFYTIYGIAEALEPLMKDGKTMEKRPYTILSNEPENTAQDQSPASRFSITRYIAGNGTQSLEIKHSDFYSPGSVRKVQ